MDFKSELIGKLSEITSKLYGAEVKIELTVPPVENFGDYSTNVALSLSKIAKKSPIEIANEIVKEFGSNEMVDNIEVVNPGFINFFLNKGALAKAILEKSEAGRVHSTPPQVIKFIVEHTSVNPNKAMHVGHLRNAILGDSIGRLLKRLGQKVEIQNYIDDTGLQVADTTNAILNLGIPQEDNESFDDYCWRIYSQINAEYEKENQSLLEKRKEISHAIEEGNNDIAKKSSEIVEKILDEQIAQLWNLNIGYDLLVYERDVVRSGLWDIVFEQLKKSPNFVKVEDGKNAGCWVLKNEGDGGDKVYVRSDGTKVYTAKDTAYHFWKFGLIDFDFLYKERENFPSIWQTSEDGHKSTRFGKGYTIINVVDERQTYPMEMVKKALGLLGHTLQFHNFNHLAYGTVNLSEETAKALNIDTSSGQSSYAMSGRKGIGVKAKDLVKLITDKIKETKMQSDDIDESVLNKIAVGAVRFYMLKNHPSSPIIFDYQQALSIEGFTGPYLQYSYARARSILNKINEPITNNSEIVKDINDNEIKLLKVIDEWEEILKSASQSMNISLISEYAFNLSSAFNSFYHTSPVLNEKEEVKNFRLRIINSFVSTLSDALNILGIDAVEKM